MTDELRRHQIQANLAQISNAQAWRRAAALAATRLVAVSKTKPASDILAAIDSGQLEFGENYVQEALGKIHAIQAPGLTWHLIGPLQSNKCREVAEHFHWMQTLDRAKLIEPLARFRPPNKAPLQVLIQVNIDDESSKSGCHPSEIADLAAQIARHTSLQLRGLMAIPKPTENFDLRRQSFQAMRRLFLALQSEFPVLDTLSMGMSDDYEMALEEGATLIRVGSAVFGRR